MAVARRCSPQVAPNRPEPGLHFILREHRERLLERGRGPVLTAFSEKENILDVIFDNSTGLVGLAIETRTVSFDLGNAVGNLVPENGLKAIETQFTGSDLYIRVERYKIVASAALPSDTNIADNTTDSTAANKDACALPPNAIQLSEKVVVVLEMPHLIAVAGRVFLERPIRW